MTSCIHISHSFFLQHTYKHCMDRCVYQGNTSDNTWAIQQYTSQNIAQLYIPCPRKCSGQNNQYDIHKQHTMKKLRVIHVPLNIQWLDFPVSIVWLSFLWNGIEKKDHVYCRWYRQTLWTDTCTCISTDTWSIHQPSMVWHSGKNWLSVAWVLVKY